MSCLKPFVYVLTILRVELYGPLASVSHVWPIPLRTLIPKPTTEQCHTPTEETETILVKRLLAKECGWIGASTDTRLATAAVPATPGFHLRRWTVVAAQQCRCTYCPETQLRLLYFMACIVLLCPSHFIFSSECHTCILFKAYPPLLSISNSFWYPKYSVKLLYVL